MSAVPCGCRVRPDHTPCVWLGSLHPNSNGCLRDHSRLAGPRLRHSVADNGQSTRQKHPRLRSQNHGSSSCSSSLVNEFCCHKIFQRTAYALEQGDVIRSPPDLLLTADNLV